MAPKVMDELAEEIAALRREAAAAFPSNLPPWIASILDESSLYLEEQVISKWRRERKYDEVIDYILYQFPDSGGTELWRQVLLDLRLEGHFDRGHRLLEGLFQGRLERFKVAAEKLRQHPENHFALAEASKREGELAEVLYEHAFLLENRPDDEKDTTLVGLVRERIFEALR